jgi:hypothetical protein
LPATINWYDKECAPCKAALCHSTRAGLVLAVKAVPDDARHAQGGLFLFAQLINAAEDERVQISGVESAVTHIVEQVIYTASGHKLRFCASQDFSKPNRKARKERQGESFAK